MQKLQVYSANSFSEVIERLAFFRPSGLLTIWPAADTHQEEASLLVEAGQLLRLYWGRYEGEVNEYLLYQLTLWGQIHFVFRVREPLPQLTPPAPPGARARTPSRPLPQVDGAQPPTVAFSIQPGSISEFTVPTLTETARSYPVMTLPRYDRTILLLIDGRRTVADISRLTRRTFSAVCASLTRLRDQQIVDVPG